MEKRLNKKLETYVGDFKKLICEKLKQNIDGDGTSHTDIIEFVYEYPRLVFTKDDFEKRKRVKNTISDDIRCCAKRANSERCTRRKLCGSEFCGTHSKGTPNGTIIGNDAVCTTISMDVEAYNIDGIIYYIDDKNNVYKTEDIMSNKQDPEMIGKRRQHNGVEIIDFIH